MKHTNFKTHIFTLSAFFALLLSPGCENYNKVETASWNVQKPQSPEPEPGEPEPGEPGYEPGSGVDEVDFGSLNWTYGKFNGSKAVQSGVQISNLKTTRNNFSFKWDANFAAWGKPASGHMELCAWFVKRNDGVWVGGKFDWISNSHNGQVFHHFYPPGTSLIYEDWGQLNWGSVPNPCEVAFVIVEGNAKRRSNVLRSTWAR